MSMLFIGNSKREKIILVLLIWLYSTASNRIIHAKDHASIQINLVDVDESTGRMTDTSKTYAICGAIRRMVSWSWSLLCFVYCFVFVIELFLNTLWNTNYLRHNKRWSLLSRIGNRISIVHFLRTDRGRPIAYPFHKIAKIN